MAQSKLWGNLVKVQDVTDTRMLSNAQQMPWGGRLPTFKMTDLAEREEVAIWQTGRAVGL